MHLKRQSSLSQRSPLDPPYTPASPSSSPSLSSSEEPTSRTASRLKPLRLSMILNSSAPNLLGSAASSSSSFIPSGSLPSLTSGPTAMSSSFVPSPFSPSVSSDYSISVNTLVCPASPGNAKSKLTALCSSLFHLLIQQVQPPSRRIPTSDYDQHTQSFKRQPSIVHQQLEDEYQSMPHSAPISRRSSWHRISDLDYKRSSSRASMLNTPSDLRPSSRMSDRLGALDEDTEVDFVETPEENDVDDTIIGPAVSSTPGHAHSRPPSVLYSPVHAIATPRPTLLFAIASDDVSGVRRVLESGEAGPNDDVGPQSALAFTLTANQLKHRMEIVKLLLAHGANPSTLNSDGSRSSSRATSLSDRERDDGSGRFTPTMQNVLESIDPATRFVREQSLKYAAVGEDLVTIADWTLTGII